LTFVKGQGCIAGGRLAIMVNARIDTTARIGRYKRLQMRERPMTSTHQIDISLLRLKEARDLAPLLAAYAQALKRGAPRRPDEFYAETLLQDRTAEVL